MRTSHDPARRKLFATALAAAPAVLWALSASGCGGSAMSDRGLRFASLDQAMQEAARLAQARALDPASAWNWAQTLEHCAQSIEYSMTGYPQARSALFQRTLGAAAFNVFTWRGQMTHSLDEDIPGAPALNSAASVEAAHLRLRKAVQDFEQWQGPMRSHFAYGPLDKPQFALAHAMHLANHFSAFEPVA